VCPIVRDDAWERHFKSQLDTWQQQATTAAAAGAAAVAAVAAAAAPAGMALSTSTPQGRSTSVGGAAVAGAQAQAQAASGAAAKEGKRQQLAMLALERHLADGQPAPFVLVPQPAASVQPPAAAAGAPPPGSAHGVARKRGAAASTAAAGATAAKGDDAAAVAISAATPGGPVRPLKAAGNAAVALAPETAVKRLPAVRLDGTAGAGAGTSQAGAGQAVVPAGAASSNGAVGPGWVLPSSEIEAHKAEAAALQAHQVGGKGQVHGPSQEGGRRNEAYC
jgi:hypothetical protein